MYTPDPEKWIANILTAGAIVLSVWKMKRSEAKEVKKRHEENQAVLQQLAVERKYFPPHVHNEKAGPLTVDGISSAPGSD